MNTRFQTPVLCPTCNQTIDVYYSESREINGMAAAMLFGDSSRHHRRENPDCVEIGWNYGKTIEVKEE